VQLVQRGDREQGDDPGGGVGEQRAVGQPTEAVLDQRLDGCGEREADHQDDDGDEHQRQVSDHRVQVAADRVGAEHPERRRQHEQHDRVEDNLGQKPGRVVLTVGQRLLHPAALDQVVEPDFLQHPGQDLGDGLGDHIADHQDDQENDELGDERRDIAPRIAQAGLVVDGEDRHAVLLTGRCSQSGRQRAVAEAAASWW